MRILVLEDDPRLLTTIQQAMDRAGFVIDCAQDGVSGEEMGRDPGYALAILDLGLPGRPGLQVLQNWRRAGVFLPVIILTARNSWRERIDGLEAGADDYLGKPFHVEELITRIRTVLRRCHTQTQGVLSAGSLQLDELRKEVILAPDAVIPLTASEFKLLRCFLLNPGRVLSKETLYLHLYQSDDDADINIIETHIMRLRKKIGEQRIRTLRGHGYRLASRDDHA
ncbi:MAG: response regulator transcription factor [Magnetococcales bacterium]|nr:response regulator transcription factor [Magnetococcales bacterium]